VPWHTILEPNHFENVMNQHAVDGFGKGVPLLK
jgi:hypothetical protein